MGLYPIYKTRLSQFAVQRIKDYMEAEHLQPGDRLPSERNLIERFGISRTSVREAFGILEMMGFVEIKAGSGTFVLRTDFDHSRTYTDLAQKLSDAGSMSKKEIRHKFEARLVIEPGMAALAAVRRSEKCLVAMREAVSGLETEVRRADLFGTIILDAEFHRHIAQASRNKTLIAIMETIRHHLFEEWRFTFKTPVRMPTNFAEHEAVFKAIEGGCPEQARAAMHDHLEKALERNMNSA
jgi:GntR family transcriptional regulator, transcriptional repressor for pyruvate dehydrogenase complex